MWYDRDMSGPLSLAVYAIAAVFVGIALDWAIFERFKVIVGAFGDDSEVRYRELPYWRLALVVLASATVGVSLASQTLLAFPFWAGTVLFFISNVFGDAAALRR